MTLINRAISVPCPLEACGAAPNEPCRDPRPQGGWDIRPFFSVHDERADARAGVKLP